jgi:hypothetical protein
VSLDTSSDSKPFFLREIPRTNNIAQKIFSSIAHIKQSSKKFLAKNNSVGRSRDALESALAFAPPRIRVSIRVRE